MRLYGALQTNIFLVQKKDCKGRFGISGLQKATAGNRILAYECVSDAMDEYLRLGASTTDRCVSEFVKHSFLVLKVSTCVRLQHWT